MKDKWRTKYRKSLDRDTKKRVSILTGFDIGLETHVEAEEVTKNTDQPEAEIVEPVKSIGQLRSCIAHCSENKQNRTLKGKNLHEILPEESKKTIGGSAGISANFLSNTGNYVGIYTPVLSEKVTERLNDDIVSPELDGKLVLKRATECTNSDRTKNDAVIKLNNGENYLKLSGKMQGFGPYFRSGVEENFSYLDHEIDRIILSGFQETEGNHESKLIKSSQQLEKIETEKHLEYVTMSQKKRQLMIEEVIPKLESISLDEAGAKELTEELEIQAEGDLNAEDALNLGKALLDMERIKRCHIQTYSYQVCVTEADYRIDASKIRDAMLYAQISSTAMAETGSIPEEEKIQKIELYGKHVHRLDPLEDMANHLDNEDFVETGVYSGSDIKVVAIPTLIEEDPSRVDGLRTLSSSGAFTEEIR